MSNADQEVREAGRAGSVNREGLLTAEGGRAVGKDGRPPSAAPAFRLKRALDLFPAADGALYLTRSGAGEDFVIGEPTAADRVLLELLSDGFRSDDELHAALRERGLPAGQVGDSLEQLEELGLIERRPVDGLLSPAELGRYDRQLIYFADLAPPGVPAPELQRRLGSATVAVLGCGGLGSWAASALACAGVGTLVLIDDDQVEPSNLNRQLLYRERDIGRLKVEAAAEALCGHNRSLQVVPLARRVEGPGDLAGALGGASFLIAVADWPPYELPRWVNQACLEAGVPFIGAGQFPPRIRVGPLVVPGRSACLECLERRIRRDYPHYRALSRRAAAPSHAATLGAASGAAGSLLAMEAIHFLVGLWPPPLLDAALVFDLRTMRAQRTSIQRDPACPECGTGGEPPPIGPRSKDQATLERLLVRSS